MSRSVIVALALAPLVSLLPATSGSAAVSLHAVASSSLHAVASSRSDGGTLRVVAKGIPQGSSAKITVAGKRFRKKLPRAGKLRNLRPGTYRVWAAPIVADGGASAVPNLPVRVKVRKSRPAVLRLRYSWNPKTDSYPPGQATGLDVTQQTTKSVSLRWTNGRAPDLQAVAVRRKLGAQAPQTLDDGQVVATDRLATSATDSGLKSYTTYSYSVFMLDVAGNASKPATTTTRTAGEASALTAGTAHTCALLKATLSSGEPAATGAAGSVECWGDNSHGQLGNGSFSDAPNPLPVDLPDVVQVVAGFDHTCARQSAGEVWCWGRNDYGQLGRASTSDSALPVRVDLPYATDLSAGGDHTCAVVSAAVRCWGRNDHGQLGVAPSDHRADPVTVTGLPNAASVATGYAHSCAVLTTGSVRCWGSNDSGQLGVNTRVESATPVRPSLPPAVALTAGVSHTCALLADQSVSCWGANAYGQLGDGTTVDRLAPMPVTLPATSSIGAGAYHTCAVLAGGTARCWGRNSAGRLGDGTGTDRALPTRVDGLTAASGITAGGYHSCAVTAIGSQCWGSNGHGQLGVRGSTEQLRPTIVAGL